MHFVKGNNFGTLKSKIEQLQTYVPATAPAATVAGASRHFLACGGRLMGGVLNRRGNLDHAFKDRSAYFPHVLFGKSLHQSNQLPQRKSSSGRYVTLWPLKLAWYRNSAAAKRMRFYKWSVNRKL